jgi:hypothetical protein
VDDGNKKVTFNARRWHLAVVFWPVAPMPLSRKADPS